jgi:signal transduction histidine kinase
VEAADAERRRLERNLHDGAQQRLVSLSATLGLTMAELGEEQGELHGALGRALAELRAAQSELRALARGIHPAVLTDQGLSAAIESLAEQCPVAVETRVPAGRYTAVVEATAYFLVCEALTNMAKHARASSGRVHVRDDQNRLVVEVVDDGVGGAELGRGSGLVGLADRTAAVGGRFRIDSPPGGGTRLTAELPCG